jgi:penicillin-insensitive murein DD-endopeptidase
MPSHLSAALLTVALPITLVALPAQALPGAAWATVVGPLAGPARVIGRYDASCIAGALPAALDGTGYQLLDPARRRFFGHPDLLAFVVDLGRAVAAQRLGILSVGDMAQPRGGPMSSGHVSHQGGLDVDLWFRLDLPSLPRSARDGIPQPPVVDPATGRLDPVRFDHRNEDLIRLAAQDPRVSRVFVGAAIKRDLCQRSWPDRSWLRIVRPWPGHDDHLHVRLRCPAGSPACVDQPAAPSGEGCSAAELAPLFARERAERLRPPPVPHRILPPACNALFSAAH